MRSSGVAAGGTDASAHAIFLWKEREAKAGLLERRPRAGPGQSNGQHKSTARAVPLSPVTPPLHREQHGAALHTPDFAGGDISHRRESSRHSRLHVPTHTNPAVHTGRPNQGKEQQ